MISCDIRKIANAVGGKTARACDCCIRRRARWYCAADDAFLCQTCDGSVHSANPLARRHHRVRLKTASSVNQPDPTDLPPWQRGLTRKARTPRQGKNSNGGSKSRERNGLNPLPTVPDLGSDDTTSSHGDETDEYGYQVPVFDPFVEVEGFGATRSPEIKSSHEGYQFPDMNMDMDDLEEFAADVETLLGKGLDEESYGIEELGLLDSNYASNNKDMDDHIFHDHHFPYDYGKLVKAENNDELLCNNIVGEDVEIREPFDVYGDEFPSTCQGETEEQRVLKVETLMGEGERHDFCNLEVDDEEEKNKETEKKRKILLRLDYQAISAAWASQSQSSPWLDGQQPEINPDDDYWPNCTGTSGAELRYPLFGDHQMGGNNNGVMRDGGREARVSRYREKRRTRLFAKKIRYEVRKLNAEKRPRMKGRFVKRTSFAPQSTTTCFPLLSK